MKRLPILAACAAAVLVCAVVGAQSFPTSPKIQVNGVDQTGLGIIDFSAGTRTGNKLALGTGSSGAATVPAPTAAGKMLYDTGTGYAAFGACTTAQVPLGQGAAAPTCGQVTSARMSSTITAGTYDGTTLDAAGRATSAKRTEFNVYDSGATGDGVADDTTAYQTACASACAVGGVVLFPCGQFKVASSCVCTLSGSNDADLIVRGSGSCSQIHLTNGAAEVFLYAGNYSHAVIEDLTFLGKNVSTDLNYLFFAQSGKSAEIRRSLFFGVHTANHLFQCAASNCIIRDSFFYGGASTLSTGAILKPSAGGELIFEDSIAYDFGNFNGTHYQKGSYGGGWVRTDDAVWPVGALASTSTGTIIIRGSRFDEGAAMFNAIAPASSKRYTRILVEDNQYLASNTTTGLSIAQAEYVRFERNVISVRSNSLTTLALADAGDVVLEHNRLEDVSGSPNGIGKVTADASTRSVSSYDNSIQTLTCSATVCLSRRETTVNGVAAAATLGYELSNETLSTVGTQVQRAPTFRMSGSGWDVNDAVARAVYFEEQIAPVAGNTVTGKLLWTSSVAGAAAAERMSLDTSGRLIVGNGSGIIEADSIGENATNQFLFPIMTAGYMAVWNNPQEISTSGAQAVNTTTRVTRAFGGAAGDNITSTLGDSVTAGQQKSLILATITAGKTWVVTPTNLENYTSITMAAIHDGAELAWNTSKGKWQIVDLKGLAVANP